MENQFALLEVFGDDKLGYRGNIAGVVFLPQPLETGKMQSIAADINQPATAFLWPLKPGNYGVRWFAPDAEIELCGHGAMAAIAYMGEQIGDGPINLEAKKNRISGEFEGGSDAYILLDALEVKKELSVSSELQKAIGARIKGFFETENKHLLILESEEDVKELKPDMAALRELPYFGYVVTAPGHKVDFVSRTFVPKVKQLEDPATGSSHAILTSYWSKELKKDKLIAHQLSERGGLFECEIEDGKVKLRGQFRCIVTGQINKSLIS